MCYKFLCINYKEKANSKNASQTILNVFMPYLKFSFGHWIILDSDYKIYVLHKNGLFKKHLKMKNPKILMKFMYSKFLYSKKSQTIP